MLSKFALTVTALLAVLIFSACGSSDLTSANVNGTWNLAASGDAPKSTWKVTSSCASGPCNFKADMGLGQSVTFTWDNASGTYTYATSANMPCLDSAGKKIAGATVKVSSTTTFTPTAASGDNLTAADVKTTTNSSVSPTSKKTDCNAASGAIPAAQQKATRTADES